MHALPLHMLHSCLPMLLCRSEHGVALAQAVADAEASRRAELRLRADASLACSEAQAAREEAEKLR